MYKSREKKIVTLLYRHPEGLTIGQIAKMIGVSRITAKAELIPLVTLNKIRVRNVGSAKLHYLEALK